MVPGDEEATTMELRASPHEAIAVSEMIPVGVVDAPTEAAAATYKAALRRGLPDIETDAIDALTSREFWRVLWLGVGPTRQEASGPPAGSSSGSPVPGGADRAEGTGRYWRRVVGRVPRYFKRVDGQDHILEANQWVPYNRYKSGPSWWSLTGEADADIIVAADLPPDAPR